MKRLITSAMLFILGVTLTPNAFAQDKDGDKYAAIKAELKVINDAALKYAKDHDGAIPYFQENERRAFLDALKLLKEKNYLKDEQLNPKVDKSDMIGFFLELPKKPEKPLLVCAARVLVDKKMFFALTDGSVVTIDISSREKAKAALEKYLPKSFFLKNKILGNEFSAIGTLRALHSAQAIFLETSKVQRYGSLAELFEKKMIDKVLASGKKNGYQFKIHLGDKDGKNKEYVFHMTAAPIEVSKTGNRYFYTDQSGVIREETGKPATEKSPAIGQKNKKSEPEKKKKKVNNVRGTSIEANEAKAIKHLRSLNVAQAINLERSKNNEYGTLKELRKGYYIGEFLASGKTDGYHFQVQVGDKDGYQKAYVYSITATPIEPGKTGKLHFYTAQDGVVRYSEKGPATEKSPPIEQRKKK